MRRSLVLLDVRAAIIEVLMASRDVAVVPQRKVTPVAENKPDQRAGIWSSEVTASLTVTVEDRLERLPMVRLHHRLILKLQRRPVVTPRNLALVVDAYPRSAGLVSRLRSAVDRHSELRVSPAASFSDDFPAFTVS